jgi:DNA-binding NtrC family response regulator
MITVVIAENEAKVQTMLSHMLSQEGYAMSGENNGVRVIKKGPGTEMLSLEEKVVELQDELFSEKKGELYKSIVERIERAIIEHALERSEGNQFRAARILGINRNTIRSKIKKLGLDAKKWKA